MWEVEIGAAIYSLKWCSLHGKIIIISFKALSCPWNTCIPVFWKFVV